MVAFDFPRMLRDARPHTLSRIADRDTPVIDQPVRMVSVDTPEKAEYAGLPPTAQAKLDRCRQRLQDGIYQELPENLRNYLVSGSPRTRPSGTSMPVSAPPRNSRRCWTAASPVPTGSGARSPPSLPGS